MLQKYHMPLNKNKKVLARITCQTGVVYAARLLNLICQLGWV